MPQPLRTGDHKRDFFVFDCCENVAYFNQDLPVAAGSLSPSISQRLFGERLELVLALGDATGGGDGTESDGGLREDTVAVLQDQVAGMNLDNFLAGGGDRPGHGEIAQQPAVIEQAYAALPSAGIYHTVADVREVNTDLPERRSRVESWQDAGDARREHTLIFAPSGRLTQEVASVPRDPGTTSRPSG